MISGHSLERPEATPAAQPAGALRPGVRSQILEAALTEFAEKSFQQTSLAAIARRLGVTAPLVLYHFGSKANLRREAVDVLCSGFAAGVEQAVADGLSLDGAGALRLLVRRLVHFFAVNRAAYRLMREDGGAGTAEAEWFSARNLRPVIAQIENVYRRAVAEGAVRPAPFETTFFMILGMASCYLESRALASHLFSANDENAGWIDDYADQVVAMCFEGLSGGAGRSNAARPTAVTTTTVDAEAART